jgi:hypothetical protein
LPRSLLFLLVFDLEAAHPDEAEELYLDASMPELLRLLQSDLTDEELANHPLRNQRLPLQPSGAVKGLPPSRGSDPP